MGIGNNDKHKQTEKEPANNSKTDNLTEKTMNNASNVDIDISPNNSHYDVTIGEKT